MWYLVSDTVAEWLRRLTRNQLDLFRVGSSPTGVVYILFYLFQKFSSRGILQVLFHYLSYFSESIPFLVAKIDNMIVVLGKTTCNLQSVSQNCFYIHVDSHSLLHDVTTRTMSPTLHMRDDGSCNCGGRFEIPDWCVTYGQTLMHFPQLSLKRAENGIKS